MLVRFRTLSSNHPRLSQVTVQSGSFPVTNRNNWSAFVLRVAVAPFTDCVSTPVSKASERSSALPAFETSVVVPLASLVGPSCRSRRVCPASCKAPDATAFDATLDNAAFAAISGAVAVMNLSVAAAWLISSLFRGPLELSTVVAVPALTAF